MEFCGEFASIQGILNSVSKITGNFTTIRHVGGNEQKISKIVENLQQLLNRKKFFEEGKVNTKYEGKIRQIILFFILNTELSNKSLITNNKVIHLIDIIPQFSKCVLTNVIFGLELYQYYGEAISSLPIPISLELLENCSKCIKRSNPYKIIEQTSIIASSIYFKSYHLRYESCTKLDAQVAKLIEKFNEITKNYVAIVTDEILMWETDKMYQYMGQTIYEVLKLLKNCFNIYEMKEFVAPFYQFYQFTQENAHVVIDSPSTLNKSNDILKEFNKHLMSVCEGNVIAVSVDVFCAWSECTINEGNLQEVVAYLAYDVLQLMKSFGDTGDLPKMLSGIARKPQTIEEKINNADQLTILQNVQIQSEHQSLWYKAFIRSGIFETEEIYNIFKELIFLSDVEDFTYLLSLNNEVKTEYDLKEFILQYLLGHQAEENIKIISEYFMKNGINDIYEMDDFNIQVRELLNKLKCDENEQIPFKEISVLVLQNPIKFINNLLEESDKNVDHLGNILQILDFISPICNLKCNDKEHTVFHEMVLNKLKYSNFEPNAETCVVELINQLITHRFISNIIYDQLEELIEDSIVNFHFKRAIFICQLFKKLPLSSMPCDNYIPVILKLGSLISQLRWTFFTYSEEKVTLTSEIIYLIYHYKDNLQDDIITENLKSTQDLLNNKIDSFHVLRDFKTESENFLTYVIATYDINSSHHQQVTCLINLLPRCVPLEWQLVAKYLIKNKNPTSVIQLFIDVMLILSEMSKKSSNNQDSLSYCFQQFCIVMKDLMHSAETKDTEMEKSFIKNICRLIKHLPDSLHNTVEISLINLFDFNVLKSLKDDEDFLYSLVSISHLNICKIICSKMT